MRSRFDEQLELLNKEMIMMGAMCENAIAGSAKALAGGGADSEQVSECSAQIDRKEREIESLCLRLLLQQQPVASDLRVISSALKMITDMERIGDQSADIAEIAASAEVGITEDTGDIRDMAVSVIKMVTDSIDAFVKRDVAAARAVIEYDDVVDGYFAKIKRGLTDRFAENETEAERAIDLLMIAKYFERIGDHAANIASWVVFSITGSRE